MNKILFLGIFLLVLTGCSAQKFDDSLTVHSGTCFREIHTNNLYRLDNLDATGHFKVTYINNTSLKYFLEGQDASFAVAKCP